MRDANSNRSSDGSINSRNSCISSKEAMSNPRMTVLQTINEALNTVFINSGNSVSGGSSSDSSRTYARTSPASHCRQSVRAELVMMEGNMPNSSERVFTQKSECLGVRE